MGKTWRDICAPVIADILRATKDDLKARKKALREAYPFGERRCWPYKVWLSEIKRQTGQKKISGKSQPLPLFDQNL